MYEATFLVKLHKCLGKYLHAQTIIFNLTNLKGCYLCKPICAIMFAYLINDRETRATQGLMPCRATYMHTAVKHVARAQFPSKLLLNKVLNFEHFRFQAQS